MNLEVGLHIDDESPTSISHKLYETFGTVDFKNSGAYPNLAIYVRSPEKAEDIAAEFELLARELRNQRNEKAAAEAGLKSLAETADPAPAEMPF